MNHHPFSPPQHLYPSTAQVTLERQAAERPLVVAIRTTATLTLLALIGILAEGKFLLELAAELTVHGDKLLASSDEGLAGADAAVRLDTDHHLRHIRVSDCE